MATCEYSLDGAEWIELPVGPRFDPILSLVDTDAECETDGGARYVYRQSRRDRWQLRFRVTTEQLEAFRELHTLIDGKVRPFYLRLGGDRFTTIEIYGRKESGIFPRGISIPAAQVVYDYDIVISGEIPAIEVLSMSDFYTKTEAEARFVDEAELAAALSSYTLPADSVGNIQLLDDAVTALKIAADAVTTAKIAASAVTADEIAANAVTTTKLADDAVSAVKIATGAITTIKLADSAITDVKVATSAITTVKLADSAITTVKIADNQITTPKLVANVITANEIAANAVTTSKIDALAVTAAKIAALTITAAQIAANTITANEIAANAITTSKLNALAVTAAKIAANTITAAQIAAGTITATEIAANTITAGKIAALTITGSEIAANAITAGKIAAGEITADKMNISSLAAISANIGAITAGSLDAVDITGGSITGTEFMTAGAGNNRVTINTTDGFFMTDSSDITHVQINASVYAGILLNGLRSIDTNDIFMESQDQSVQLFVSQASGRVSFAMGGATRGYFDASDGSGAGNQPTSLVIRVNGSLQRVNRASSGGFLYI